MYLKPRCWIDSEAPPPLIMMRLCFSATAVAVAACAEPIVDTSRSTLSLVIRRSYRRAEVAGSERSSYTTNSTFLPSRPPAALVWSRQSSTPRQ